MTATMHVVCLKATGHVLAAIAATTVGAAPDLAALVGADLPLAALRATNAAADLPPTRTYVPQSELELKSVPYDAAVIAQPLHHAVDGGRVVTLPDLAAPAQNANPLDNTRLVVTNGAVDTAVFTVVSGHGDPLGTRRVQSGKFVSTLAPPAADPLDLVLHILPGDTQATIDNGFDYDIFIAMAGRRPFWGAETLP